MYLKDKIFHETQLKGNCIGTTNAILKNKQHWMIEFKYKKCYNTKSSYFISKNDERDMRRKSLFDVLM